MVTEMIKDSGEFARIVDTLEGTTHGAEGNTQSETQKRNKEETTR